MESMRLPLFELPNLPRAAKKAPQSSSAALLCCTPNAVAVSRFESLVERYEQEAYAERTRAIYQSDWALFERWCSTHGFTACSETDTTSAITTNVTTLFAARPPASTRCPPVTAALQRAPCS